MLNVERLMASEIMALSTGEEFKAAVRLWCFAWKQVPAGSLPNDEKILAAFTGNTRRWSAVRTMALRGFVLCSDGRLYHKTLCEDVLTAWMKKLERWEQTRAAAAIVRVDKERRGEVASAVPLPPRGSPSRMILAAYYASFGRQLED